jgi:hypothetical protein
LSLKYPYLREKIIPTKKLEQEVESEDFKLKD